jgi:hypothetical protein
VPFAGALLSCALLRAPPPPAGAASRNPARNRLEPKPTWAPALSGETWPRTGRTPGPCSRSGTRSQSPAALAARTASHAPLSAVRSGVTPSQSLICLLLLSI